MGESQRRKGAKGERELTALLPGARKVSYAYQPGADVEWQGHLIEVKRRKDAFKFDYKHLKDVTILAKRSDNQEWLLTLRLTDFLDMLDYE